MVSIHSEKTCHILGNLQLQSEHSNHLWKLRRSSTFGLSTRPTVTVDIRQPLGKNGTPLIFPLAFPTMDGMFKTSPPSVLKYLGIGVLCIHHVQITKPFAVFLLLGVKGTMVSLDAFHPSRQAFAQMPLAPHKGLVKTLRTTFTSVMAGLNLQPKGRLHHQPQTMQYFSGQKLPFN